VYTSFNDSGSVIGRFFRAKTKSH